MSASYVFEVDTDLEEQELRLQLKAICTNVFDVDVLRVGDGLQVFLNYALGKKSEAETVLKVVRRLQSLSKKAGVFYIPCYDAYEDSTLIREKRLKPEEIFSKKYFPSLSIQENFKYLLTPL